MPFNEKEMVENRNAKVSAMETIVSKAKAENRLPSDEEKAQFTNLKKEIEDIDDAISMEKEVQNMGMIKVPETSTAAETSVEDKERKQFANVLRSIRNEDTPTTTTDGKVMIPTTVWDHIIEKVEDICPIYQWADKFNIKGNFVIPKDNDEGNLAVAYAEEFTELESGNVKLTSIELKGYLAGVLAKISLSLVNNTNFDIVGFVEAKIARKIAKFIEKELLKGTTGKAEGLSGVTQIVRTAAVGTITSDELMDVQDAVPDQYQGSSYWIMSRKTRNKIRQLKDKEGDYLLNRDLTAKWGYTLLGRDVYTSDNMDELGTKDNNVIFYGDFSGLAVKLSETADIQILREKYLTQHAMGLVAWMEFDAKVADTEKIAKLVDGPSGE